MPFLTIKQLLPDLEELSDLSIRQPPPEKDPHKVTHHVILEVSEDALEFLKGEIARLTGTLKATRGQSRSTVSRRRRLIAQREFIFLLGWEIARSVRQAEEDAQPPVIHSREQPRPFAELHRVETRIQDGLLSNSSGKK